MFPARFVPAFRERGGRGQTYGLVVAPSDPGRIEIRFDGSGAGGITSGQADGESWTLAPMAMDPRLPRLVLVTRPATDGASGDLSAIHLGVSPTVGFAVMVSSTGHHRYVWGVAPEGASSVRVRGANAETATVNTVPDAVEGRPAFVIATPTTVIPSEIEAFDSAGAVLAVEAVPGPPDIEVEAVEGGGGRSGLVAKGRTGGITWDVALEERPESVTAVLATRGPDAATTTASLRRPFARQDAAPVIGLADVKLTPSTFALYAWTDPEATGVRVHLHSGWTMDIPALAVGLDVGVRFFGVVLPIDAMPRLVEARRADGSSLGSALVEGHPANGWLRAESSRRPLANAPAILEALWDQITARIAPLTDEPSPVDLRRTSIGWDEVRARWPIRPLLLLPDELEGDTTWELVCMRMDAASRVVHLALQATISSRRFLAPITLGQGLVWRDPPARPSLGDNREPIDVRGRPGHLETTADVTVSWTEDTGLPAPADTVHVTLTAAAYRVTAEELLQLANELRVEPG